jgi:hypothetical protein
MYEYLNFKNKPSEYLQFELFLKISITVNIFVNYVGIKSCFYLSFSKLLVYELIEIRYLLSLLLVLSYIILFRQCLFLKYDFEKNINF